MIFQGRSFISILPKMVTPQKIADHRYVYPVRRVLYRASKWRHRDIFALDINSSYSGFFAQLNWCVYAFAYCESRDLVPRVRLIGRGYSSKPGHDWLHDFFDDVMPPIERSRIAKSVRITHIQQTDLARLAASMTLERANGLLTKYLRVNSSLADYVDRFVADHFAPGATIGVHYRGSDKIHEAIPVQWEMFTQAIQNQVARHAEMKTIFVASDDRLFIEWMQERFAGQLNVVRHEDLECCQGNVAIHHNTAGDGYRKGFEALVNCLLLSRCDVLFRSASFLSGWSSVFNPALPVTMLNRPHAEKMWFPDREVLRKSNLMN